MKQKTRILIYILIAAAFVILGSIAIISNHSADVPVSAQEHIDLGRIYLVDLSYEKASLEFTEAIEIEPMNADAYLGLAESYVGMGDTEKAIDVLEEGYDKTGDERLKDMLEELQPSEETTFTTVATTGDTTTVSTVAMAIVPDLLGLTEEEAIAACESAGLKCSVSYGYSDEVEKGYVVSQVIPVNASVAEGISVPFTVSDGVEVVTAAPTTDFVIIKGREYDKHSTWLHLAGKDLTNEDIKPLAEMKNLTKLDLGSDSGLDDNGNYYRFTNRISDISVLKDLTNLTELNLEDNQINDISILKNLTNLNKLNLTGNPISDINALKNLTNLTKLELCANQINDISPLENLTNLTDLWLIGNQISDITPLKNLTNLTNLYLNHNQISDISPLKNLTNLTYLYLDNNQISDISVFRNFISFSYSGSGLHSLNLENNQISDISGLINCNTLCILNLKNNQVSEIEVLKYLDRLAEVDLRGNPIGNEDIKDLKETLLDGYGLVIFKDEDLTNFTLQE